MMILQTRSICWPGTLAVALILSLASPTKAAAATYYVATYGSDDNSCDAAQDINTPKRNMTGDGGGIACMRDPGDTLLVRAGTYDESINNYTPPYWLPSGSDWDNPVTIAAYPGETVTIQPTTGPCDGRPCRVLEFDDSDHYLAISGFILDASSAAYEAVKFSGGDHIMLSNNEIKNGATGIFGGSYNQILNNDIHDNGQNDFDHGIYVTGPGNVMQGNTVHHNTGWGIHIYSSGHTDVSDNSVIGNYVYSNGTSGTRGAGILLSSGSNNMAYNNMVESNLSGIEIGFGASAAAVYDNTIVGNSGGCIVVGPDSTDAVIDGDTCYLNGWGILDEGSGTQQTNNQVD